MPNPTTDMYVPYRCASSPHHCFYHASPPAFPPLCHHHFNNLPLPYPVPSGSRHPRPVSLVLPQLACPITIVSDHCHISHLTFRLLGHFFCSTRPLQHCWLGCVMSLCSRVSLRIASVTFVLLHVLLEQCSKKWRGFRSWADSVWVFHPGLARHLLLVGKEQPWMFCCVFRVACVAKVLSPAVLALPSLALVGSRVLLSWSAVLV